MQAAAAFAVLLLPVSVACFLFRQSNALFVQTAVGLACTACTVDLGLLQCWGLFGGIACGETEVQRVYGFHIQLVKLLD